MSYHPYHKAIVEAVEKLKSFEESYLATLQVLAEFAQTVQVPRDHRASVAKTFQKLADDLKETNCWTDEQAAQVIVECEAVATAMHTQQELDDAQKPAS